MLVPKQLKCGKRELNYNQSFFNRLKILLQNIIVIKVNKRKKAFKN